MAQENINNESGQAEEKGSTARSKKTSPPSYVKPHKEPKPKAGWLEFITIQYFLVCWISQRLIYIIFQLCARNVSTLLCVALQRCIIKECSNPATPMPSQPKNAITHARIAAPASISPLTEPLAEISTTLTASHSISTTKVSWYLEIPSVVRI